MRSQRKTLLTMLGELKVRLETAQTRGVASQVPQRCGVAVNGLNPQRTRLAACLLRPWSGAWLLPCKTLTATASTPFALSVPRPQFIARRPNTLLPIRMFLRKTTTSKLCSPPTAAACLTWSSTRNRSRWPRGEPSCPRTPVCLQSLKATCQPRPL